ncbi:CwfJ C-terminus 1-domain-containing protein-like protein [Suillus plorans]|uniref:CwfJ C-terminus 1-domain-containing protein-like protein n=1 Tax=Suillus plorans TaxID=116603 RepID=A0A9P7IYZ0_9AGAM|nr:CwfJ C-terminus 1-domain-containing protein-like protein [Suillus plorans]KAG1797728.1 CwfJ C-terminus 1-domain-containing protein-like protein [Suillus plorans]
MGDDRERHSTSKHKRSRDKDDHKSKKKHKSEHKSHKRKSHTEAVNITDDDANDDDMWVEKNIDNDGERLLATDIPTAESLKITSHATAGEGDPSLPPNLTTETRLQRDEWMLMPSSGIAEPLNSSRPSAQGLPTGDKTFTEDYGESSSSQRTPAGGVDFFSSLGTERKRPPRPDKADPDKIKISSKELNQDIRTGHSIDNDVPPPPSKVTTPGGPGSNWRMMRLRRVYETAAEENKPIEEVALERFGTLQAFEEAKEERHILDERQGKRSERKDERGRGRETGGEKRFMFTDVGASGASSRSSSFRRPGSGPTGSTPSTPSPTNPPANRRLDSLRLPSQAASPLAQSHTPIPNVMTPSMASTSTRRAMSPSSLNKLQAQVLRAKLMNAPNAEKLEEEYEAEVRRANGEEGGVRTRVEVLPTLDARGRMYDVGYGKDDAEKGPGNKRKKEKFETRDAKTGELLRYNADDDEITLGEMVRHERFGAGMADQKNLDAQFAKAIMGDGKFQNDLDYMDDNAERLGRQKMRTDAMKRQFAVHDYKRTQKALATCQFCYGEDDSPPKAPVVAMGTQAYLSCTLNEELLDGHCLIVPIQHHLTMLEADDDVWDEVRNFMKSVMRMFAEEDKGVIFYETVISLKPQKHTCIECVPLTWDKYDDIPAYFKESILASEAEWSTHKKLIDFSARPGGFRRAMVPNLPYFMVQFDYKGEKGYGHVIEGTGESAATGEEDGALDEGDKGGGDFPRYFAGEIIGNVLDLDPRRWMRPRRVDYRHNKDRIQRFKNMYEKFDWTGLIGKS